MTQGSCALLDGTALESGKTVDCIKHSCALIEKSSGCIAHRRRHSQQKSDLAVLVSPLWARLTRFLRHPHTLRTVQSPKLAPRNWRVVASPSTTCGRCVDSRRSNAQLALSASCQRVATPGEQRKCISPDGCGCWFRSRPTSSYRGHRAMVLIELGEE